MKKTVSIIFILIICIPIIFQLIFNIFNKRIDLSFKGYFNSYTKPKLTWKTFKNGEYQTSFNNYWDNNLIPRGAAIKSFNQLQMDAFRLGNRVIGYNNDLFETTYINDALAIKDWDFSDKEKDNQMYSYVSKLQSINDKLLEKGKYLLVYTTPSKGTYNYDNIPYRYKVLKNENGIRGVDVFKKYIKNTNVPYLDSKEIMEQSKYPTFYPTGIHWARPVEQEMKIAIYNKLADISNKNLRIIELENIKEQSNPFWRDADLYDILNVLKKPNKDIKYYEYEENKIYPTSYENLKMFVEGGSFSLGLTYNNYLSDDIYQTFYEQRIFSQNTDELLQLHGNWDNANLKNYLDKVDFVVIEINEAVLNKYSNGFVDYLDKYLDTYNVSTPKYSYGINLDTSIKTGLENTRGYYDYEDGFVFAKRNNVIRLKNEHISNKGLEINFSIPSEVINNNKKDNVRIYINQNLVYNEIISTDKDINLIFNKSDLKITKDDVYEVEIICEHQLFLNDRDTAIKLKYIGEVR